MSTTSGPGRRAQLQALPAPARSAAHGETLKANKASSAARKKFMSTSRLSASSRALHPVDTNLAAHDRTDPYASLSTLRQLFSALPVRASAWQYKLTPDEHRLAMHLLGAVEPFVHPVTPSACTCPARTRPTLVRLPTELLDAVAFWVDSPRDLRALAGTCRRLRGVVVPRHTDYRVVRCKASSVRVWHHLVVHRGLAQHVRRLEVLDERSSARELVPTGIQVTETDLESTDDELGMHAKQERWLLAAIGRMTALRSVRWECNHTLVAFEHVWPTLARCGSLEEVDVNDNLVFRPPDDVEAENASKERQLVLRDLKKVGIHGTKSTFGAVREPDLARVSAMLSSCPNLEALAVSYIPRRTPGFLDPVADDFLLCGRWANLRSLTLTSLWCSPNAGLDAAASFLLAHANLEVLHLDVTFGAGGQAGGAAWAAFKFPPGCLPRLRELKASRELASAILACPVESTSPRPLETLKGARLSGSSRDRIFLENLKTYGSHTVRRLELAGWSEMEDIRKLAECVPQLAWLDLGKKESPAGCSSNGAPGSSKLAANISSNVAEWGDLLAQFPELTTFHGVRFFYEVSVEGAALSLSDRSRVRKNDEVASVLAWKCPKLRRLDYWEDGTGKILVLARDADRVRYEVRRVKT